jgi:hypothetical protein
MIRIITPFSRYHLQKTQEEHLRPFDVLWQVIPHQAFYSSQNWVTWHIRDNPQAYDIAYEKLNWFIDLLRKKIQSRPDVIFVATQTKNSTMWASPDNCKVYGAGLRSYVVRGEVVEKMRFNEESHSADGMMAQWLKETQKNIQYCNDLVVIHDGFAEEIK